MIRSFTRIPLRRYIHTPRRPPPPSEGSPIRLVLGLAATVAAVTYFSSSKPQRISSDVPSAVASPKKTPSDEDSESTQSYATPEPTHSDPTEPDPATDTPSLPEGFEPSQDEESSGGAFNPVTGEINWDCPCLGGMAHGPCGPQFREAFSCFVFSEQEPKGVDCIEKFKNMQDCFREHPDVYGDEIMDDDEDEDTTSDESGLPTEGSEAAVPPSSTEIKQVDSPQTQSS